jgi:hypothetical protein
LSDNGIASTSYFKIVRPDSETEKYERNQQSKYCCGVGMLLYLIKFVRTDLHVVRILSKFMEGANLAVCEEMLKVVKFAWDERIIV